MIHPNSRKLIYLGVWLFILPFLGVPMVWKMYLTGTTGAVIVILSLISLALSDHKRVPVAEAETPTEA